MSFHFFKPFSILYLFNRMICGMYNDRRAGYVPRATRPGISADTIHAGCHHDSRAIFSSITSTVLFKVKEENSLGSLYINTMATSATPDEHMSDASDSSAYAPKSKTVYV
jgi:hypothetical protein